MERLVDWVWANRRSSARATFVAVGLVVSCLFTVPANTALYSLYFSFDWPTAVAVAATYLAVTVVGVGGALASGNRAEWSAFSRWIDGDRSDPEGTYAMIARLPQRIERRGWVTQGVPFVVVLLPVLFRESGLSTQGGLVLVLFLAFGVHNGMLTLRASVEGVLRPVRSEIAMTLPGGGTVQTAGRFATLRYRLIVLSLGWGFTGIVIVGSFVAAADSRSGGFIAAVLVGLVAAAIFGPTYLDDAAVRPILRPISDLGAAAARVIAGNYAEHTPVTSDDELGQLVETFNRMQDGLLERERLHSAFGSYVDPTLAARLLAQGGPLFKAERVTVTVLFFDIRNFTAFAEAAGAEATVARLNDVFEIIVPIATARGGHLNKFLGDGAIAVFGAPVELTDHADRALTAAAEMRDQIGARFGDDLHIGIGINTGPVIAGTIGGGDKLEFTVIGDTVNVSSRVEQLTKTTGDTILLTQATLGALTSPPDGLIDRGTHEIKGKVGPIQVHAVQPTTTQADRT